MNIYKVHVVLLWSEVTIVFVHIPAVVLAGCLLF